VIKFGEKASYNSVRGLCLPSSRFLFDVMLMSETMKRRIGRKRS